MSLSIFQVDAFTDHLFGGNPAAVVPFESWLPDGIMQQIAAENNLAETAFFVKEPTGFRIRWFTPLAEVDLCGHATLGTAHVLFDHMGYPDSMLEFKSRSGILRVRKEGELMTLDFPADDMIQVDIPNDLAVAVGLIPVLAFKGKTDYMLVYETEEEIRKIRPNMHLLMQTEARGVVVTAPGDTVDFVSRFFAPQVGIPEDPVTGSAHTSLIPYWSKGLGKTELSARQLSNRIGDLRCRFNGDRVEISGKAVTYMKGEIFIDS
ncbi:MAG: PhzF family phenazine biosynthesis protein [Bacteroidales bacterium]|nr:PhzF family phenazine biosynthesis protein [Bacteroidales bacterium]